MRALILALLFTTFAHAQVGTAPSRPFTLVHDTTLLGAGTTASPLGINPAAIPTATPFNCISTGTDAGGNKSCNVTRSGRVSAPTFVVTGIPVQNPATGYRGLVYDTDTGVIGAEPIINTLSSVLQNDLTTPPATPALGDDYLVPAGATGAWAGQTNKIANWTGSSWGFYTPVTNDATTVTTGANAGNRYVFNGGAWVLTPAVVSSNWALGGNAIPAARSLGSTSNFDIPLIRGNSTKATLTANGLTLPSAVGLWALNNAGVAGRLVISSGTTALIGAIDAAHTATQVGVGASNTFTALYAGGLPRIQCTSLGCTISSQAANISGLIFSSFNAATPTSGVAGTVNTALMCVNASGQTVTCTTPAAGNYTSSQNNSAAFSLPSKQITYRGNTGAASVTLPACVLGDWTTYVQEGSGAVITYSANVRNNGVSNTVYTGPFKHQLVCANSGAWTVIN